MSISKDAKKTAFVIAFVAMLMMGLAACDPTTEDRGGGREMFGGSDVDDVKDVDEIVVWRNANNWPNFAQVCAGGEAYVMRRNDAGNGAGVALQPDPQRREECQ